MSKARQLAQKPTQPTGRKNLIINGAMQVAQRGTSVTGQTAGQYNTVDRLMLEVSGGTYDHEQSTDAPNGFKNSVKVTNSGAFTPTASQYFIPFEFRFERDDLAHLAYGTSDAKTVTLSFWIKSNKTGTYTVDFYNSPGNRRWAQSYTIDVANTWEQKTLTWTGDTSQSFGSGTSGGGYFYFWMTGGTNFTSGSLPSDWENLNNANRAVGVPTSLADGDAFYLTGVQLEVGSVATEFEHRSYGEELALCQRYYQIAALYTISGFYNMKWQGLPTNIFSTTRAFFSLEFPVEMRAYPTITVDSPLFYVASNGASKTITTQPSNTYQSTTGIGIDMSNSGSNFTVGAGAHTDLGSGCKITVDAEL